MLRRLLVAVPIALAVAIPVGGVAAAALTAGPSTHSMTGIEHVYLSNFNRVTLLPAVAVAQGVFTDAGTYSSSNDGAKSTTTYSKGKVFGNNSKIKEATKFIKKTCFFDVTISGSVSLTGGTGAYKGITGTLALSGSVVGVLPSKNGKCIETATTPAVQAPGEYFATGKVTLGS